MRKGDLRFAGLTVLVKWTTTATVTTTAASSTTFFALAIDFYV